MILTTESKYCATQNKHLGNTFGNAHPKVNPHMAERGGAVATLSWPPPLFEGRPKVASIFKFNDAGARAGVFLLFVILLKAMPIWSSDVLCEQAFDDLPESCKFEMRDMREDSCANASWVECFGVVASILDMTNSTYLECARHSRVKSVVGGNLVCEALNCRSLDLSVLRCSAFGCLES